MAMKDWQFLEMAKIVAATSKCVSLQVGAVLVKDGRVISTGYNGTPPGFVNCCDVHKSRGPEHTEWSNQYEIHAEMNALLFAARNGISVEGATMFCTIEPCHQCVKNIVAAGVKQVVFAEGYYREQIDSKVKMDFALRCGLELVKFVPESTTASRRPESVPTQNGSVINPIVLESTAEQKPEQTSGSVTLRRSQSQPDLKEFDFTGLGTPQNLPDFRTIFGMKDLHDEF